MKKKWPNDHRIGCNSPFSLADFFESDFNLEEKLEEFKGAFKRDEVVELEILNKNFPKFSCILK